LQLAAGKKIIGCPQVVLQSGWVFPVVVSLAR